MCRGCGKLWTTLQVVWSTVYVICGGAQLISGIFFLITIPTLHLTCNIWTGSWNIIIGIIGGMLSCLSQLSSNRQEVLLYAAISILTLNTINIILSEWGFFYSELLKKHPSHIFSTYACFATRIATITVILTSFFDTQFTFCSLHLEKKSKKIEKNPQELVSDIEYIIPRSKNIPKNSVKDDYSQSWVFDSSTPNNDLLEPTYLRILQNGSSTPIKNGTTHLIENPVVHIEEASDDSTSDNSDRKLCHMRSFSRSNSPVHPSSNSSSNVNLKNDKCLYDCLETIYRSRDAMYQSPQNMGLKTVEPVQYASLMKELQKAIIDKKISPDSSSSSDAEFSKELEAALQLIQDLETPVEAPDNSGKPPVHSQSTSGYSSPSHVTTPSWSSTSSTTGSGYSIRKEDCATVISLHGTEPPPRSVTVVKIVPNDDNADEGKEKGWRSLLRKKKSIPPKLCPELEAAIVKSESLAYLSERELLARHERNKEIQREIEERVIQQWGINLKTESNC